MKNWKPIVGIGFTPKEFDVYCHSLQWNAWRPSFCVLHNTANPKLTDRPVGFNHQHMVNLEKYYRDEKKWSAGPHLFIDDLKIWVFTPLTMSGIHSPTWNKVSLGIELLGNYENESLISGRGKLVIENGISALSNLHSVLGLNPETLMFHKEDPLTKHDCPGKNIVKAEIIKRVKAALLEKHSGEHSV